MIRIILALLFLVETSQAQYGADYLALQSESFNYEEAERLAHKDFALGSLDYTFGSDITPVHYFLSGGKVSVYRVHLLDGTCVRNSVCGKGYPLRRYTVRTFESAALKGDLRLYRFLSERVSLYCSLHFEFPSVRFILSPVLEHNLSEAAWRKLARHVKHLCPVEIINSGTTGVRFRGYLNEMHGAASGFDIVSGDGIAIPRFCPWAKSFKSRVKLMWHESFNCRVTEGKFITPKERTSCTTNKLFTLLQRDMRRCM